jgi:hypothetical protein
VRTRDAECSRDPPTAGGCRVPARPRRDARGTPRRCGRCRGLAQATDCALGQCAGRAAASGQLPMLASQARGYGLSGARPWPGRPRLSAGGSREPESGAQEFGRAEDVIGGEPVGDDHSHPDRRLAWSAGFSGPLLLSGTPPELYRRQEELAGWAPDTMRPSSVITSPSVKPYFPLR